MKEINLRDYYPFYTNDLTVEVPDEVADLLGNTHCWKKPIGFVHTAIKRFIRWTMTETLSGMLPFRDLHFWKLWSGGA